MSKTSTEVKSRWNKAHYKEFRSQIKPELYESIIAYMERENISRSQFLERAIEALNKDTPQ